MSTLDNLAHYIETTAGEVQIQWPASISNETESYQLIFIDTPTGAPFGQSSIFNLTVPLGESRNATLGTTGAVGPHTAPSAGLSDGAIAGIVIGILVAVAALLTCLWIFLRRRHRRKLQEAEDQELKNELDGVATSKSRTELGNDEGTHKGRAELDEKKQFLEFELPSTPPRSPAEMEVPEIPAAEMPAGRPSSNYFSAKRNPEGPLSETSENTDSTLVPEQSHQQHTIARKPVPTSQRIAEEGALASVSDVNRPSLSLPDRPSSARADTASLSSTRTPRTRQTPFQAALHDLISQELRRPDA